jgi:hypothetical protein
MAIVAPSIMGLTSHFDTEGDILYLSLGNPVPSYGEEKPEGLVYRWAYSDDRPCGVTVVGFRAHQWGARARKLSQLAAAHLNLDWHQVKEEIRQVT